MKKLMMYPAGKDTIFAIENIKQKSYYNVSVVYGYAEQEYQLKKIKERYPDIICGIGNPEKCLSIIDTVFFAELTVTHSKKQLMNLFHLALLCNKEIFISILLLKECGIESLQNIRNNHNVHLLHDYSCTSDSDDLLLKEIDIPIISIISEGMESQKFELTQKVTNICIKEGYQTKGLTLNPLGTLLGMELIPGFILDDHLGFEKKVFMLNRWISQNICDQELIILEIPGGIMQLNRFERNHFSECALTICNALEVDDGILVVYHDFNPEDEVIDKIFNLCSYKFNIKMKYICVSNRVFQTDYENRKIVYKNACDISYIQKRINNNRRIFTIDDQKSIKRIVREFINDYRGIPIEI